MEATESEETPTRFPRQGERMRAIVQDRYGGPDALELREVERPALEDDQVLVRVRAVAINPSDAFQIKGLALPIRMIARTGLRRPKQPIPGQDLAGVVEAVGERVTEFRPGDEVFGARGVALAEYVCGRERNLVPKPAGISFEQAAAIAVAGCTALQAVRDHGRVQPGQRVLVNGASGGVGTFTVQIARALGAEVTGVCSGGNVELVRSIGAERVVDYTREDFTKSGQTYDVILDNVGNRSVSDLRRLLTPDGTLVLVGARSAASGLARVVAALVLSRFVRHRLAFFVAGIRKEDLVALKELVEAGKLMPIVDRTYPLSEAADAIRYLETRHARAKVVVTV